jgi:conjugal transfer mating pair stabilization protein TraN
VPTGDPIADQECAAVKFMNKDCVALTNSQAQVVGAAGVGTPCGTDCSGTYGAGMSNFGFQNQITATDPIFHLSQNAQNNATSASDSNCVSTPVVTHPAEYETNTCSKTVSTDLKTCSQELSIAVTTSYTKAQITYSCAGGVLQGQYCVSTSSSPATASYSCPNGGTLNGTSCVSQTSIPATSHYTCASGELNGQSCVSQTSMPATSYYTCASGALNGQSCVTSSPAVGVSSCPPPQMSYTPPEIWTLSYDSNNNAWCTHWATDRDDPFGSLSFLASTSYACPNGGTLSGNTCTTTTTATLNYKCDSGTLSGSSCITESTTPAGITYTCDSGTLSGSSCITETTIPASVAYTCASGTLSGSQCVTSTSTPASTHYSCPGGASPVGDQCITYSTQVSWIDNCTPYEQSAGSRLGDPK